MRGGMVVVGGSSALRDRDDAARMAASAIHELVQLVAQTVHPYPIAHGSQVAGKSFHTRVRPINAPVAVAIATRVAWA